MELQQLMQNIKGDVLDKLKESREEYLNIFNRGEDERQRSEKIRLDRTEVDTGNT